METNSPKIAGGGIICANCGSAIIPVKSKFGCGFFVILLLLGIIPGLFYLIYYAGKRIDTCPVCEKNAYIKEVVSTDAGEKAPPLKKGGKIIIIALLGTTILIILLAAIFSQIK